MNATFPDTLLQLFQQVSNNPDSIPASAVDGWQQGSVEWQVLNGFQEMLERLQRSKQEALEAQKQRDEKEALYRSIFEATLEQLCILDLEGTIVEVNPAACRMYGYSYEELLGMKGADIAAPDSLQVVTENVQAALAGDKQLKPVRVNCVRKDGTTFPIEGRATRLMYKGQPHIMTVAHDISEQAAAEQELRQKEAEYRSIFEATSDALIIIDTEDGRIVEVNPAACKTYGYEYNEFIGLPAIVTSHTDDHTYILETVIPMILAGGEFRARGVGLRKDGTTFHLEVHDTAFTYHGKPHILAAIRDITEQVQAEQALREKEEQYRSIFEASTDGLVINDLEDGHLVDFNPAMHLMHGYRHEEFMNLHPTTFIHPDSLGLFADYLNTVKAGKPFIARAVDLRKDGTPFPVEVHGTSFTYKGKPHVLAIVRDITEQAQAEEQLREKEEQYHSIFEATTDGLFIVDLEDGHCVEANPAACSIYGYSYDEFIGLPPSAFIHSEKLSNFTEKAIPLIRSGGKRHIQGVNLRKDGSAFPVDLYQTAITYKGKRHMLVVVRDITEQVQAQQLLEQRVDERTRELSTLLEISHNVASTIELKPLLGLVLDQLKVVADYTGSSFSIVEGDDLVLVDNRGPAPLEQVMQLHLPIKRMGLIWEMFCRREPVVIADVHDDTSLAQAFREWMKERMVTTFSYIRAWMGVPLTLKEQVIGMLTLSSHEPNYYTPQHARMAMAIANQAAVAIENARLYERAQELAAVEERQRLARELHDSVSQALYGISLGAHTAFTLLKRDPQLVVEPLSYVLTQAEAALTEMRALIFELRPESLETEGLVVALGRQAASLQARHGITVVSELDDEPELPIKVKQEFYRIAQEALHNTVKHARAKKVDLRLQCSKEGLLLEVCDDGVGFDAEGSFPGHLGLRSMRERVTRLGGFLQIESAAGQGTRIRVRLPALAKQL